MQERFFKVFFINSSGVDTENHEHLTGVSNRQTIHNFASTFTSNKL